ncbi:MAG: GyrI-like domain-containing protein [Bellilinea sp.]|jgi:DNA gyrase inhibitor GyrI
MNANEVRIIRLPALRVVSVHGFGTQPENEAWQKLAAFAAPRGWLDGAQKRRIFGFNNPSPSPGSPNYGYEFWITVDEGETPQGEVEVKHFSGGLYAVLFCEVASDPNNSIPAAWERLAVWRERSRYQSGSHQWLEEHLLMPGAPEGQFNLDLYFPIRE